MDTASDGLSSVSEGDLSEGNGELGLGLVGAWCFQEPQKLGLGLGALMGVNRLSIGIL